MESITQDTQVTSSIEKEMEMHIESTQTWKDTSKVYDIFKDKAVHIGNQIKDVKNPEHLKIAMKKLDALATFISIASNENQIIPFESNKKNIKHIDRQIIKQNSFFSTENKKFKKMDDDLTWSISDEAMDLYGLKRHDFEHSYSKTMNH